MSLLERAEVKFPEGTNGPKVAPKDGAPADLTNELVVNAKEALKLHWAKRRYDKMQPKQRHAALGYKLDREEALGYMVASALNKPLLSPDEARAIGKRAGVLPALEKVATHRKRGTLSSPECVALLSEPAPLSFAPAPRKTVATAMPPPPPRQPPLKPPPAPPPKPHPPPAPTPAVLPPASSYRDLFYSWQEADVEELKSSREADEAITRAQDLEHYYLDDDDVEYRDSEEEKEIAIVRYKHALTRLKAAYPSLCPGWHGELQRACEQNSMPCAAACGGKLGVWPWTVQTHALGFCTCNVVYTMRSMWSDACYWKHEAGVGVPNNGDGLAWARRAILLRMCEEEDGLAAV